MTQKEGWRRRRIPMDKKENVRVYREKEQIRGEKEGWSQKLRESNGRGTKERAKEHNSSQIF